MSATGGGATGLLGAVMVVSTGSARAGTIPPVSAVNEIAAPEASTTATPRQRQIQSVVLIAAQLLSSLRGVAVRPPRRPCTAISLQRSPALAHDPLLYRAGFMFMSVGLKQVPCH